MKKGKVLLTCCSALAAVFTAARAENGAEPVPRVQAEGRWVLVKDKRTVGGERPQIIHKLYRNIIGKVRAFIITSGKIQVYKPIKAQAEGHVRSGNWEELSVSGISASASRSEVKAWRWLPHRSAVVNKDVLVSITGSANASVSAEIKCCTVRDSACASTSISAEASGSVGGKKVAGMSIQEKTVKCRAYITEHRHETSYDISGECESTDDGGGISASLNTSNEVINVGEPIVTKTINVTASIQGTGNTNNVKVYGTTLSQSVSGSLAASCSSRFDRTKEQFQDGESKANFYAESDFYISTD